MAICLGRECQSQGYVPWGSANPSTNSENIVKNALKVALEKRGYETLTPVQREVSNPELENADLLVSAQTGSGKPSDLALPSRKTF